ncbi:lipopolysaccharide assembly protein LapB [uncultured Finegoldia sp.]|uniref:tetratricopeptide repeat protein n=1 Tax=uncultured Finegoldia sp. TaxID=328009 RepID=UPI002608AFCA|nr:hypothetical protein [uncultured Finegoldia sp.]
MSKKIDEYFSKFMNELVYVNLLESNDYINKDVPLPVLKNDLVDGVKNNDFVNNFDLNLIIKGMIYNIAYDRTFKYCVNYTDIMYNIIPELEKSIISMGIEKISNPSEAVVYFRANDILKCDIADNAYYYAYCLRLMAIEDEYNFPVFVQEAFRVLNENIRNFPDFFLNYIELANLELLNQNYIKAFDYLKNTYKMASDSINYDDKKVGIVLNEVERLMNKIRPLRDLDFAITLINSQPNKALDIFENLEKTPRIIYLMGKCFMNLNQSDKALEYFDRAEKSGFDNVDLYNDMSVVYFNSYDFEKSIQVLNRGLKIHKDNEILLYNKAVIELNANRIENAKDTLSTLVSYDDVDEDIFNMSMQLLKKIEEGY